MTATFARLPLIPIFLPESATQYLDGIAVIVDHEGVGEWTGNGYPDPPSSVEFQR